jgi:hypothetical protein
MGTEVRAVFEGDMAEEGLSKKELKGRFFVGVQGRPAGRICPPGRGLVTEEVEG